MNHLFKKYDSIEGAGINAIFGVDSKAKKSGKKAAKDQIKQLELERKAREAFRPVLSPPKLGATSMASSFSYYESIDMLTDGPIYGLVTKNGLLASPLEGIYLDGVPIISNRVYDYHYDGIEYDDTGYDVINGGISFTNNTVIRDTIGLRLDQTIDLISGFCKNFVSFNNHYISSYSASNNMSIYGKFDGFKYINKAGYKVNNQEIIITTPPKDSSLAMNSQFTASFESWFTFSYPNPSFPTNVLVSVNQINHGLKNFEEIKVYDNVIPDINDPLVFIAGIHTVEVIDANNFTFKDISIVTTALSRRFLYWSKVSIIPQRSSYVFNIAPLKKIPRFVLQPIREEYLGYDSNGDELIGPSPDYNMIDFDRTSTLQNNFFNEFLKPHLDQILYEYNYGNDIQKDYINKLFIDSIGDDWIGNVNNLTSYWIRNMTMNLKINTEKDCFFILKAPEVPQIFSNTLNIFTPLDRSKSRFTLIKDLDENKKTGETTYLNNLNGNLQFFDFLCPILDEKNSCVNYNIKGCFLIVIRNCRKNEILEYDSGLYEYIDGTFGDSYQMNRYYAEFVFDSDILKELIKAKYLSYRTETT